ncbi:MAG: hypothetical protein HND42_11325 [Armatimonadetes bacterium]|nr:hypothetical protein [Armatimonadota bacterium]NOG93821.1 hypothetical protein [Armatimonadota bacterium]
MHFAAAAFMLALGQTNVFPTAEDKREIEELLRFQRQYGDGIWPGFARANIPILLYDDQFEYLIGHPSPPEGWTRIEVGFLPGKDLHRRPPHKPSAFTVRVEDIWCASFATFDYMAMRLKSGRELHIAATIHEMFHAFQAQTAPDRFKSAMAVYAFESKYPESDSAVLEDWKREGSLLADALATATPDETRSAVSNFLAFRSERRKRAKLDRDLIAYETQLEWLEGMGKYAEVRIIELASLDTKTPPLYDLSAATRRRMSDSFQLRSGLAIAKGDIRYYQTGLAQARLLDRLLPKWKEVGLHKLCLEDLLASIR